MLLARDGHRVTIFERFDAPAPIGSGLMIQPTGLAVLRGLGLDRALIARSARIDRLSGRASGRTVLDVTYALAKGLHGADSVGDGLAAAHALRRRHVRWYQTLTALFTPVYQSDSRVLPLMRDRAVGPLSGCGRRTVFRRRWSAA